MKQVDPEKLIEFLDDKSMGCPQRECEADQKIIEVYQN